MRLSDALVAALETSIRAATDKTFRIRTDQRVSGGDTSAAFVVTGQDERVFFVKSGAADRRTMFDSEAAGLGELARATSLRVPAVVVCDTTAHEAYLVLEYLPLRRVARAAMGQLGEGIAEMHGVVEPRHGWSQDNHLGATPQYNARHADWTEFWRENRLAVMIDALAPAHAALARDGDRLLAVLPDLLAGHVPEASLLHGDLWRGNVGMTVDGCPAIYDPAVYYGDRETDLAMTELFGGFSPEFYAAYWGAWPARPGYREIRRPLYQLYHLLNHARMFGGGYVAQAHGLVRELLAKQ